MARVPLSAQVMVIAQDMVTTAVNSLGACGTPKTRSQFQAAHSPEDRAVLPLRPLCTDTPEVPLLKGLCKEASWSVLLCPFSVLHPRQRDPRLLLGQGEAGVLPSGGSPWLGRPVAPFAPAPSEHLLSSPIWSSSLVLPRISLSGFTQVS